MYCNVFYLNYYYYYGLNTAQFCSSHIIFLYYFIDYLCWKRKARWKIKKTPILAFFSHHAKFPLGHLLKALQLRRLFDWTNMAADLHQFFGVTRHPCIEVSGNHLLL